MPYSKVKWITIDAGGTLLFANPSVGAIYAEVLEKHGQTAKPELLEESFFRIWTQDVRNCMPSVTAASERQRWRSVIDRTFADFSDSVDLNALFDDLWQAFAEPQRWKLPENAEETLQHLKSRGYKLAILSNWDERLRPLLTEMKLDHYFDEIFVSCEVGYEKPDPQLFKLVERKLGATGTEILHIGDSHHHDILGANARGWLSVHAFCDHPPESGCTGIAGFRELPPLL